MPHGDNAPSSLVMIVVEIVFPIEYMKIDIGNTITFDYTRNVDFQDIPWLIDLPAP